MRVVIAGGGTGGHLYPGIALAQTFQKIESNAKVLFVGTAQGMEAKLLPEKGFLFAAISAKGFVGKGITGRLKSLFLVPVGLIQSISILRDFSPQLVIGIGGYAAGPVLLAAVLLKIKRIILEPNLVPGLANKLVAPWVDLAVIAFEETRAYLRTNRFLRAGVPVRPEIVEAGVGKSVSQYAPTDTKTLLILGGSQGAQSINRAMVAALPHLGQEKGSFQIIHQTGKRDLEEVKEAYERSGLSARVEPFIHDMAAVYSEADLVISRAGAGTLSELGAVGKPSLLVPYPLATGHQEKNAAAFVSAGAAEMILDRDLDGRRLAERIVFLLSDPKRLSEMAGAARRQGHPHSAEEIVEACYQLVGAEGRD
ncbi:MAG: undecaprenyldiphospho-muramoylpentapeptide beta-N-acetylglucosaminyltransferase [Candidatus Manganitrophus sp.]|nr:undecaprenyldiphospho-muramoylpentapeptide beta-N-acetylglucosaminyltransferase [Candidatus Manganitrophus sp.]WDT69553.1 MAG: undecaprenyldiphospho-muramoylpentapeptide beta-N-acetylglucosaminyltransferase [Candidatus Manganitrophus sp.]